MTPEQIRQIAVFSGLPTEQYHAIDQVLTTGALLKNGDEPCSVSVLDANGDPLCRDKKYWHKGKIIRVTGWEFGAGHSFETYYRVMFIDQNLDNHWLVVDGRYPNGLFGGASYKSELRPYT